MALKRYVDIQGGTTQAASQLLEAALHADNGTLGSAFSTWMASIHDNPMLLEKELRSICELFDYADDQDSKTKKANCQEAQTKYLSVYSSAGCKKCENEGIAVNVDKTCKCACTEGFGGPSCKYQFKESHETAVQAALNDGSTKVRSFASVAKPAATTGQSYADSIVKFITTNGVARDPPHLKLLEIGKYDDIIRAYDDVIYVLSTTETHFGTYQNITQGATAYSISIYDEYLNFIKSDPIDFTDIPCDDSLCYVMDFDVVMPGKYVFSIQRQMILDNPVVSTTHIYRLDAGISDLDMTIDLPCNDTDTIANSFTYLSLSCKGDLFVSCPGDMATVRKFDSMGRRSQVTQFKGYTNTITSVQLFNDYLWFRTKENEIAAFHSETWAQGYHSSVTPGPGDALPHSQLWVDAMGNLIGAQTHSNSAINGTMNNKFGLYEGQCSPDAKEITNCNPNVLFNTLLTKWDSCKYAVAVKGKLVTLCRGFENDAKHALLSFDYLK